jgi:hypothetical protein
MHVFAQTQSPRFPFHHYRLEPPLKYMPPILMTPIEPYTVADIQPLYRPTQVRFRRPYHQMVVVRHANIRHHSHPVPLAHLLKQFREMRMIPLIAKYALAMISSGRNMIPPVLQIHS